MKHQTAWKIGFLMLKKKKIENKRYNKQLKSQYVSQVFVIGYLQRIIFVFYRYRGSWHLAYQ